LYNSVSHLGNNQFYSSDCIVISRDYIIKLFRIAVGIADTDQSEDRKSTRLNSSHVSISYAVFCLKKKIKMACHNVRNPVRLPRSPPLPSSTRFQSHSSILVPCAVNHRDLHSFPTRRSSDLLYNSVSHLGNNQFYSSDCIVISRDYIIKLFRIAVGIADTDQS